MTIRLPYALAAVALFAIEVVIALFVHDGIVRPFLGDSLAVILVYLGLRAVTPMETGPAILLALATAFAIEFGQLFGLLGALGLQANPVARVVLGTGFDPMDFVAYTAGALCAAGIERWRL
ncbi:MAG: DUF2809 domain-containing protein [Candidatus Sphingomonas phytovorans]|nr:DUF2809 domain-containing protein [Sphingomonas sp.]WEJ98107.1 MAG: DUF2809 domain-containing protein [Sphingomonas sp.]